MGKHRISLNVETVGRSLFIQMLRKKISHVYDLPEIRLQLANRQPTALKQLHDERPAHSGSCDLEESTPG